MILSDWIDKFYQDDELFCDQLGELARNQPRNSKYERRNLIIHDFDTCTKLLLTVKILNYQRKSTRALMAWFVKQKQKNTKNQELQSSKIFRKHMIKSSKFY